MKASGRCVAEDRLYKLKCRLQKISGKVLNDFKSSMAMNLDVFDTNQVT